MPSAPRQFLREIRDAAAFARRRRSTDPLESEHAALVLLEKAQAKLLPGFLLGEQAKTWLTDAAFIADYRRVEPGNDRSAERKYLLRSLLGTVRDLAGDTVEVGVFAGASSWFICDTLAGTGKTHYGFDSFEGLSEPGSGDGDYWGAGDMRSAEATARAVLEPFGARLVRGWVPDCFAEVTLGELCFVHIDVDLHAPTLAAMEEMYPRLVPGGIIVCDDYGFTTCPGATRALDEYMSGRPEAIVHAPTGQGYIIKR